LKSLVLLGSLLIICFLALGYLLTPCVLCLQIQQDLDWDDNQYIPGVHDCSEMSVECEEWFETRGYRCLLVYGGNDDAAHIWNKVLVNGIWWEFESTCLNFQVMSNKYEIHYIQEGFYKDGVKYDKSQNLDNWENFK